MTQRHIPKDSTLHSTAMITSNLVQGKLSSFALILHQGNDTSRKFGNDSNKPYYILEEMSSLDSGSAVRYLHKVNIKIYKNDLYCLFSKAWNVISHSSYGGKEHGLKVTRYFSRRWKLRMWSHGKVSVILITLLNTTGLYRQVSVIFPDTTFHENHFSCS
jgi:hypothetical protein